MFIYVDIFLLLLVYQYYQRHVDNRNTMFASFALLANTVDALCVCFFLIACLCTYLFTSVCYFVESEEVILTNPEDTGKMSELVPLSRTNTGSLVWYTPRFPCLVQTNPHFHVWSFITVPRQPFLCFTYPVFVTQPNVRLML